MYLSTLFMIRFKDGLNGISAKLLLRKFTFRPRDIVQNPQDRLTSRVKIVILDNTTFDPFCIGFVGLGRG